MQHSRLNKAPDAINLELQQFRVRMSIQLLICALVQSGVLAAFAWRGMIAAWVPISFLALAAGESLLFLALYQRDVNHRWKNGDLIMPQCVTVILIQLGFIFLAPALALLFLLVLFVALASVMTHMSGRKFVACWLAYGLVSGIALWPMRDQVGGLAAAGAEVGLVWLFSWMALGLFSLARAHHVRAYDQLMTKSLQLRAALAKIDALGKHDLLTGVLNRHTLIETLESELLRANRTGHPFCFAIVDLDHFRAINDEYGNGVGDMVLRTFSDTVTHLLRALDRFGRIGGEEFGIVLPATWLDQGMIAMERLTKAVAACDWTAHGDGLVVRFSGGITTNATNDTVESIIRRSEEALAQAKRQGRNRIVQVEEEMPEMPAEINPY